jgi:hypothetical protein
VRGAGILSEVPELRLRARVANDGLTVVVDVVPGDPSGLPEISAALHAAGVVFVGRDAPLHALAERLSDPMYEARGETLSLGLVPTHGRPGWFEPVFALGLAPGHVDEDGHIDWFDRELLHPVAAGDVVGTFHPPAPGRPGRRVDGVEIPAAPSPPSPVRAGPGVRVEPDGRVIAARPGVILHVQDTTIDVVRHYDHAGDVDLRSGSLDMEGSVRVRGDVHRLFEVRATGEVEIGRGVEGGSVLAGGSVRVQGRVRGADGGIVCAEGDLVVRHAEGATLRSGGGIEVGDAVNCELAAQRIRVTRTMRGGSAAAEDSVVVQNAGASSGGATTVLAAAIPLARPVADVHARAPASTPLRALAHRAGGLRGDGARAKGGKLGRAHASVERERLTRVAQLAERRRQLLATAFVHVTGTASPGVVVRLGERVITLERPTTATRFRWDEATGDVAQEKVQR